MNQPTDAFLLNRQVELLYRNVRLGQIMSVINASFLVWVGHELFSTSLLFVWWVAALLVAGLRIGLAVRYASQPAEDRYNNAAWWRQRALLGAASSGLIWSIGALLLMLDSTTTLQLFTAFVMAGMVAGAVSVLAFDKTAFRLYSLPIILVVAYASLGSDSVHIAFSLMTVLFLVIATRSADYFHATLQDSFRLEHEKDHLIERLEQARQVAELSNRAKTEFLANISHELRTPMNGIIGLGELLSLEDLSEAQHDLLAPLRRSSEDLLRLVNNLIELGDLEAGQVTLTPSPFAVVDMLHGLLDSQRRSAQAKGLMLVEEDDPKLPSVLIGDINRLRLIFTHLVGNAIKFTDQGTVTISVSVQDQTAEGLKLRFCVSDTGPGIPPDKLALLGGLFVQSDGSAMRRHGGIGVGLPIARKLIELMGGKLDIDSAVGIGSRFSFTLPFALPRQSKRNPGYFADA